MHKHPEESQGDRAGTPRGSLITQDLRAMLGMALLQEDRKQVEDLKS